MGNEGSQVDIGVECVEVTSGWTLKNASCSSQLLSVFVSQPESSSQLELAAKNLKLYRHPGIVKYINSWSNSSLFHLATERVTPLVQVLPTLTPLQACLGLRSVLRALVFLHQTASVSHTNVCIASIYVAADNTWKLGNFEFLRKFSELTSEYLQETRARRYEAAISAKEGNFGGSPQFVDTCGFAQLAKEVINLKQIPGEMIVTATDFLSLAEKQGELSILLDHAYFSHPVVAILEFLSALTLKSGEEKENFFRVLWVQLATLPEQMVATQLADLLLSRLVLLEPSAQHNLLPWLLAVRQENAESGSIPSGECSPLFSKAVFEKHVAPKLAQIFQVRDSQVRSVLLRHFPAYCHAFSIHQLQHDILPELLVGIKDNDDDLVAATLRALADLVPLLGAATVIGGKRGKLFTDGRPKVRQPRIAKVAPMPPKPAPVIDVENQPPLEQHQDENAEVDAEVLLPERLSPDGGEAWSDWDDQSDEPAVESPAPEQPTTNQESPQLKPGPSLVDNSKIVIKKTINNDLDCLDVKMAKITAPPLQQEVDFFQDMEPVISSSSKLLIAEEESASQDTEQESTPLTPPQNKFQVNTDENWGSNLESVPLTPSQNKFQVKTDGEDWGTGEEGWGEEELDWGSNDEEIKLTNEVST